MTDDKIMLRDTHNADSRTADHAFTMDNLKEATKIHIEEVGAVMDYFASKLHEAGRIHDWTKMYNFEESYGPLVMSGVTDDKFKADPWYSTHIFTERHHLNDDAKVDANLLDVLEMIADVVTAGKGRSGHLTSKFMDIDPMLLYRCFWNTIKMVDDITYLETEDNEQ